MATLHLYTRPAYEPLRKLRCAYVGVEGPRGTAKTNAILDELMRRSLEYPGCRIVLARADRTDLSRTVLETLERQVFPRFNMTTPGNQSRANREVYDMPNGSQFIPLGLREMAKIQSFEATFAYVNEATECDKVQIQGLRATLRHLYNKIRYPKLPTWNQIIFDVNPVNPQHWTNKFMEDVDERLRYCDPRYPGKMTHEDYAELQKHNWKPLENHQRAKRIITKHMDNPGYWDFKKWDWTDAGRGYVAGTLSDYSGYLRERWLNGLWVAAEGSVFPEFDSRRNVVADFAIPEDWPVWMSVDPGYDHPCGVTWNAVAPNGTEYTIAEIKRRRTGIKDLVELIKARDIGIIRGYCDPAGKQKRQEANGVSFISQFDDLGIRLNPWPYASKELHDASVQAHRQKIVDGSYKVFASCVDTIAEHQSWSFRRNRNNEEIKGDDQYEDANNDLIDGIMGWERTQPVFSVRPPVRSRPAVWPTAPVGVKPQIMV